MYGQNYIYEPVYYNTPLIYASFWTSNYRPYYSTWNWGYYPSYYYAWNPFPVFRYRNNINICLNVNNNYNYVNNRRSSIAIELYSSRRSNGYERQHPNYAFSRRNSQVTNRYELDQRRGERNLGSRYENGYQNRNYSSREAAPQRVQQQTDYSQNRNYSSREAAPQRVQQQRDYSQNRGNSSGEAAPQRAQQQRDYSQNRGNSSVEAAQQRAQQQRGNYSSKTDNRRS
jgi:hypothetical protein